MQTFILPILILPSLTGSSKYYQEFIIVQTLGIMQCYKLTWAYVSS